MYAKQAKVCAQLRIYATIVFVALILLIVLGLAGCMDTAQAEPVVKRVIEPRVFEPLPPVVPWIKPKPRPYVPPLARLDSLTIVIDPGHGGKDSGALGLSKLPEKDIVLDIAQRLAKQLIRCGANVIMTRNSDRFVALDDRAFIPERYHADLFVSIHADSFIKTDIYGVTTLLGRTASASSKKAASCIKAAFDRDGIKTRKIRPQQLRVLESHSRPAVLIECGFLTNQVDVTNLNMPWYRDKIALTVSQGIIDYFTGYDK